MLGVLAVVFWGTSLVATRILLTNGFTPNIITFCRFLIAFLCLHILFPGVSRVKVCRKDRIYFLILGLAGTTLFFFFENTGLKYTTVANTSLITATIPLFTLITAALVFRLKLQWQNLMGIASGLAGTILLFLRDIMNSTLHLRGDLLIFGSVSMWVVYSFVFRKIGTEYPATMIVHRTFLYGLLFLIPLVLLDYEVLATIQINAQVIGSLAFLAVFCSFLAYYFWNLTLRYAGVKISSNLILLIPVVSIISGGILLQEQPPVQVYFATPLIISGAYLTSLSTTSSKF
ncbi:MAG: DMT family transporter [Candidatus Cloacimonetes bacterium]|nr:DMT family transporter [Candidatus Cloacimonadota bacterium]